MTGAEVLLKTMKGGAQEEIEARGESKGLADKNSKFTRARSHTPEGKDFFFFFLIELFVTRPFC